MADPRASTAGPAVVAAPVLPVRRPFDPALDLEDRAAVDAFAATTPSWQTIGAIAAGLPTAPRGPRAGAARARVLDAVGRMAAALTWTTADADRVRGWLTTPESTARDVGTACVMGGWMGVDRRASSALGRLGARFPGR